MNDDSVRKHRGEEVDVVKQEVAKISEDGVEDIEENKE